MEMKKRFCPCCSGYNMVLKVKDGNPAFEYWFCDDCHYILGNDKNQLFSALIIFFVLLFFLFVLFVWIMYFSGFF